jgi:hypothetical protein
MSRMSEPSHLGEAVIGLFRLSTGLSLLGKYQGDEFAEPRFLARRSDGQVIQLSRLLYLVSLAIADGGVAGSGTVGADLIAARVSQELGQEVTAANVRFLVATELAPLGVVVAGAPSRNPGPASGLAVSQTIDEAPTAPLRAIPKAPAPSPLVPEPSPLVPQANRRRRPRLAVVLGAIVVLAGAVGVTLAAVAVTRSRPAPASAAANQAQAADWVAQQVSPGTVVSCDPATCGQLRRDGFPVGRLMTLSPVTQNPLASGVVIGTAAVREEFGSRLAAIYAPLVLAGFGSGTNRVEVRATAPDGVVALEAAVSAQQASARSAGQQLLRNRTVQASPAARRDLLEGLVDARLLANLSVLSSQWPIKLMAFDGAPPGASPAVPLRGVQLSATSAAGRSAILAFLHAQRGAYRPAVATVTSDGSGQSVVTARFDAPDPMLTSAPATGSTSAP